MDSTIGAPEPAAPNDNRRRKMIIAGVAGGAVLLCCCCIFLVLAWNYGDYVVQALGGFSRAFVPLAAL